MFRYDIEILKSRSQILSLLPNLFAVADLCSTNNYGSRQYDKKNMVDLDHLKEYPYCGSMLPSMAAGGASGRAVNAKPSKKLYRWVVLLKKKNYYPKGTPTFKTRTIFGCGGTVITDR